MNYTTHRPAHLRRFGLAALCIVLAYIGFASAAKTAGAATPVIVNNGAVADRAAQKVWLSSTIVGGDSSNGANKARISLFVQHDPGRKVTGLRIDEDYNTTDAAATATLRPVTAEQPVTINGYTYSKVDFEYTVSTSGISFSCSLFSQSWATNKNIYLRAQLDNGDQTATSVSDLRFHRAANCSNPITGSFQPYTYDQTQSAQSVTAGGSVNFNFSMKNAATASLSTAPSGVRWRMRNSMTGAVSGTTENGSSFSVTFPDRGHYVIEGKPWGSPLLGGTSERGEWMYVGEVDVNGAPEATLTATRPVLDGTTNIDATDITDPDSAHGGLIQDVMWDLDFNATNGVAGFEVENLGTYNGGVSAPGLYSKTIDTDGFAPGWYPVRMKLRDNGAYSGADDARGEPIFSDQFLVDSLPVANDSNSTQLESDQTAGITLPASDVDVYPLEGINDDQDMTITIIDAPDHGTVTVPDSDKAVTYDPDNSFSGIDTFTYRADDGWGGVDTGVVTVQVDPATDWVWVPSTTTDIDARGVAPEFSSPTEGATFVKFECSLDFNTWYDCDSADEINDLDDGLHNLRVRTYGGDSTVDPTPVETEFVIDATPTVAFTSTPTPDSGDESPSFEFDVNLPGNTAPVGTLCKIEGPGQSGEFQPCASPFNLTDLNDGIYKVTVKVTDQYGKTSSSSYDWELAIGGVHTWLTEHPAAFTESADADFGFESSDPANTFECNIDNGGWAPCVSPVQLLSLGEGAHTFQVRAVTPTIPAVSDPTPASWQFVVDASAPTTTVNGTVPTRTNQPIALTFSSNEDSVTYQCSIDGGTPAPCVTPYLSPVLADGSHTLEVAAVDRAGNVDPAPVSRTWIVDTVAPTTVISAGPAADSLLNTSAADFTFAASEASALQCKMDEQSWRDCNSAIGQSYRGLSDGTHTFQVRATDQAGNVETSAPTREWKIDATSPVVGINDGPAGTVRVKDADFKFSSNEIDVTFECKVDAGTFSICTSPNALSVADGDHTFTVRATDAAGNVSEHPASRSWTVDTAAVKPPDEKDPPVEVAPCTFRSTEARCAAPVLSVSMKRVGKLKAKKSSVKAKINSGQTELSSAMITLDRKAVLSLAKAAKGKYIARAILKRADGSTTTTRLRVPRKTRPGARGIIALTGPTDFSATLRRGKLARVTFGALPPNVTGVTLSLKGKGLSIKSNRCGTQKVVSALTDREGNTATTSVFVDPPCPKTKSKGAR